MTTYYLMPVSEVCIVIASSHERRERILATVLEQKHVTAKDLAAQMDVSEATVRRDLRLMADKGDIDLVYGGATLRRPSDFSFLSKGQRNTEAKRIIGRLAADLVGEHDQIFVDSGTTCFEMATFLNRKRNLCVIANSARLALELNAPALTVLMLGGQYRPDRMDTSGPLATSTLDQLRGYLCFIGADGLSMDFGPSAADIESAHLHQHAVKNARETVVLVDHSKFLASSLFKIVDWEQVSRVVTDEPPSAAWMDFFNAHGIGVIHPQSVQSETSNGNGTTEPQGQ